MKIFTKDQFKVAKFTKTPIVSAWDRKGKFEDGKNNVNENDLNKISKDLNRFKTLRDWKLKRQSSRG